MARSGRGGYESTRPVGELRPPPGGPAPGGRPRDCEHGSLARSCEICDLEADVRRVRAENVEAMGRQSMRVVDLEHAILTHMRASYDPPSVADMGLWAHVVDLEDNDE